MYGTRLLLVFTFFVFGITASYSQSGIYESYLIVDNGSGNRYYDLQATTGNTDFDGANLGSFSCDDLLILSGAQNKVYKCNTDNITNGFLNYRIYLTSDTAPAFTNSVALPFLSNDGAAAICSPSSGTNQTWEEAAANLNVINSLALGIYYLEVYTTAGYTYTSGGGGSGTHFANNGTLNYKATFSVVDTTDPITPSLSDVTGECSATATAPTTTDACSGTLTGSTTDALTYNIQGTFIINWTFDDGNGNTIIVPQNVIVDDITDPITPSLSDVTGECSATATAPTTTDACSGTITGSTTDALTYNTQGTFIINWTFDDGNGNTIIVPQNVIVDDTTDPIIPSLSDVTGECSATATAPTTTDACSGTLTGSTTDALTYNTQGTFV
ncbi:hypothetical protein A9Q86_04270, partial [Flavobacteriales bacterium 33_180_T64]